MAKSGRVRPATAGLLLAAWAASCTAAPDGSGEIPRTGAARIEALYERHCATCHGRDGDGAGPAAAFLFPAPRDFGEGRFRLVSTENGAPTDADLVGCIERGMPGSAMPAYSWLPASDLLGLARHVRELAIARMASELQVRYAAAGRSLSPEEARDVAVWRLTPGPTVTVPPPAEPTDELLARGRTLWVERCAACHGVDGRGQTPDRAWAEFDGLYWARDLTRGVLKGRATHEAIGARVLAGMPGVAMPPVRLADPVDVSALIAHVRSMLPADADSRGVQRRQQLRAVRRDVLPTLASDALWDEAPAIDVVLMPLACRADCVGRASIRALHDGSAVSIRVSWEDPTRDDSAIGRSSRWPDQCAIQLSTEELPPLFGMGSSGHPVDIWHWAAFRARDVVGVLDLLQGRRVDATHEPVAGVVSPSNRADEVFAEGVMGPHRVAESAIDVLREYRDGRWHVVFQRSLEPDPRSYPTGARLPPGRNVELAVAIWNGSAEDRGALKSISLWHELAIDR